MTDCTLLKSGGDTSDNDGSSFYGINSAILSTGSGIVTMNGAYDESNSGKSTTIIVYGTWNLTANSYVDNVTIAEGGVINKNGYTLN